MRRRKRTKNKRRWSLMMVTNFLFKSRITKVSLVLTKMRSFSRNKTVTISWFSHLFGRQSV